MASVPVCCRYLHQGRVASWSIGAFWLLDVLCNRCYIGPCLIWGDDKISCFICRYRPECAGCVQDYHSRIAYHVEYGTYELSMVSRGTRQLLVGAGVIYSCTSFVGMSNMNSVQPIMAAERAVFYRWALLDASWPARSQPLCHDCCQSFFQHYCRERASSTYAPGPYSLAAGVVEIPYLIVQTVSQH